jgi:holin-like protein
MLRTCLVLLACQAVGECIRQLSGVPLSGPLIGMVLLVCALVAKGGASEEFTRSAQSLLGYLSLFFVPPGVGVIQHLDLLRAHWAALLTAVVVSTALAMTSGALVMQSVDRLWRSGGLRLKALPQRVGGDNG